MKRMSSGKLRLRLAKLCLVLNVDKKQLAYVLGVNWEVMLGWINSEDEYIELELMHYHNLKEVFKIVRLGRRALAVGCFHRWLHSRNVPIFGGNSALKLLMYGEYQRVKVVLAAIEYGFLS